MVTDRQVKRLWRVLSSGKTLAQAADKANMDEKTARKYRDLGRLPSEVAPERTWRTREDPFAEVWPEVHEQLQEAPGLEAKTLLVWLQGKYPGKFDDSQLRSFQRGVKRWRATAGPAKEVFFSQVHHPGLLRTTCIGKSCFPPVAFAWPTMPCGKRSLSEVTRSIWRFSIWRHVRARRRWTRRCECFWPATGL